jgi:formamidopyrimidine-DNA glycosylase
VPELPEIEVLRKSLDPLLVGDRIAGVEVRSPALREPLDRRRLARDARGRRVERLRRRGKYLLIDLEGGRTLVVHLGMSGRLTVAPGGAPREPHEHLAFRLASGRRLRLVDPRRFGLAFTARTADLETDPHLAALGVEPLAPGFDGAVLAAAAGRRRGPVKAFLMDAGVVVGLGNIYATEALWAAGIHPERSVARIARPRWEKLARAIREVLTRAIAQGGTTLRDYADGEGNAGYFQVSLAVYGREGEPCPRCGAPVRRIVQANRSTFYCPRCQR